jgi:hypothetical protein
MSTWVSDLIELSEINKDIRVSEPDMTYYDDKGSWILIYTGTNNYVKINELVELALSIDGISPLTSVYCVNDNYESFNELLAHIKEKCFPFSNTIHPDDII